jgi:HEAT repeat protein
VSDFSDGLERIKKACAFETIDHAEISGLALLCGPMQVDLLIELLDSLDDADMADDAGDGLDYYWRLRTSCSEILAKIGEPAVDRLIGALTSSNPRTRSSVASAIGMIGPKRAYEPLSIAIIKETEAITKTRMLEALGRLQDERAVEILLPYLSSKEGNGWVARIAAVALGQLGSLSAISALEQQIHSEDWFARLGAAEGLHRLMNSRAAPALRKFLRDPDSRVRDEAAAALRALGVAS